MVMERFLEKVMEFHVLSLQGFEQYPNIPKPEVTQLRHRLMNEENEEYSQAIKDNDIVEVADALGDMLYILCGTILEHGMGHIIPKVFGEIHRSNMTKFVDGKPIFRKDGKILKPDTYEKPYLRPFIANELSNKVFWARMEDSESYDEILKDAEARISIMYKDSPELNGWLGLIKELDNE